MNTKKHLIVVIALMLALASSIAHAGEADVIHVEVIISPSGVMFFDVTVQHSDTGWEHYANWWRITTKDGTEVARRVLAHPHVDEQPFTRGLDGVQLHDQMNIVYVEAHDLRHEYGGHVVKIDLLAKEGPGYMIIRK